MSSTSVRLAALGIAALALLAAPAATNAQTRHASPNGPDAGTCIQQPCSLEHAVDVAEVAGDEVKVGRGSYTLDDTLVISAIDVFGDPDFSKPTITAPLMSGVVVQNGATLRYVRVRQTGGSDAVRLGPGSELNQVYAETTGVVGGRPIDADQIGIASGLPALVANSVARKVSGPCLGAIVVSQISAVIRNVTAHNGAGCAALFVLDSGGPPDDPVVSARNLIADGTAAFDIGIDDSLGNGSPTLEVGDSFVGGPSGCNSLATCVSVGGANSTVTQVGGANDYATAPEFVDAANGDFHQTATSPTLNQGAAVGTDPADIDGDRRTIGGLLAFRDIGADERPGDLVVSGLSAVDIGTTSARLVATIDPNGGYARYQFQAPPSPLLCGALLSIDVCAPLGNSLSPVQVSEPLTGLTPSTTYQYRLQAFHSTTSHLSPIQTFTTASLPQPNPGAAPASKKKCKKGFRLKKVKGKRKCVRKKKKKG